MKREIKYRGKRNNGKWAYGSLVYSENIQPAIYFEVGKGTARSFDWCYVDADTIGQFTGLYDKNGVEIYEGDVVKTQFNKGPLGWVIWHEDGYFCVCPNKEMFENRESFTPIGELMHHHINYKKVEIEVIGNIHDNFDLL